MSNRHQEIAKTTKIDIWLAQFITNTRAPDPWFQEKKEEQR